MSISENAQLMMRMRNLIEQNNKDVRAGHVGTLINTPNVPNLNVCNTNQLQRSLNLAQKAAKTTARAPIVQEEAP